MAARTWFLVSDLHLDDRPARRNSDLALCSFLETLVASRGSGSPVHRTLVLLGDTFDLQGPVRQPVSTVVARLCGLAEEHRPVIDALAAVLRSGTALHVVGGNHDAELVRPEVAAAFNCLLGVQPGHPDVRFSPWLVHVPGVLYAEHGNQHHGLNRMPTVLTVASGDEAEHQLPVPPLAAAAAGSAWCPVDGSARARTARIAVAARSAVAQERLRGTPWYATHLAREAAALDLPVEAVTDLAAVSRLGLTGAVVGAGWRSARRRAGLARPGEHLAGRAAVVHRVLTRHGTPVPAYVLGHDHRAVRLDLPGPPQATYLNTGTWSDDIRSRGPDSVDPRLFPYVRIVATPARVDADLAFWRSPGRAER